MLITLAHDASRGPNHELGPTMDQVWTELDPEPELGQQADYLLNRLNKPNP